MKYEVKIPKKLQRKLRKLPKGTQETFHTLVKDLQESGPIQNGWSNFSSLGPGRYHCHLSLSYVACWTNEKGTLLIKVFYAGSREDAPY